MADLPVSPTGVVCHAAFYAPARPGEAHPLVDLAVLDNWIVARVAADAFAPSQFGQALRAHFPAAQRIAVEESRQTLHAEVYLPDARNVVTVEEAALWVTLFCSEPDAGEVQP